MNLHSNSGNSARFHAVGLIIAAILFCASMSPARAQARSEDRDKPTLLNSNKVDDDLDGSGSEYFYKFTAGPGKLTVTFEVKASGTNAGATLDLFDANVRAGELCLGEFKGSSRQEYVRIIEGLKQEGCDSVALVCTEIPLLVTPEVSPLPTLDSTRLLAKAAVEVAIGERPMPDWLGGPID